jgi:hypothetical protein
MRKAHPTEEPSVVREGCGPGDSGPCPICGEDMRGKTYTESSSIFPVPQSHTGRYWHMKYEHGIYEHYQRTENDGV